MLDQGTRDTLHEAIGKRVLGERLILLVECTVEAQHSLGNEGLLAVTATRVIFAGHDTLHGTQVTPWDRSAITDVVLKTDLFGAKLTLRTTDNGEIRVHRFADEGAGPALVGLLDEISDDVPLTMEPQPAVFELLGTEPPPGPPTPAGRQGTTSTILVALGAAVMLALAGVSAGVFFMLSPSAAPPVPTTSARLDPVPVEAPEPAGTTTIPSTDRQPSPEGYGLDPETIDRVMQRGSLGGCFSDAVEGGASFRGQLGLTFILEPSGTIAAVSIDDAAGVGDALAGCITTRVTRQRFPSFEGTQPQTVFWELLVE